MMRKDTKRMMHLTLFLSLSIVLHYFDPGLGMNGAKLGIANIVGIVVLKWYGPKAMITNNLLRVLIVGLMRGTLFSIPFYTSLLGVTLSTIAVILVYWFTDSSILMLSVVSSIFHPLGQSIVIAKIYNLNYTYILLPPILVLSIIAGVSTGIITEKVLKRLGR